MPPWHTLELKNDNDCFLREPLKLLYPSSPCTFAPSTHSFLAQTSPLAQPDGRSNVPAKLEALHSQIRLALCPLRTVPSIPLAFPYFVHWCPLCCHGAPSCVTVPFAPLTVQARSKITLFANHSLLRPPADSTPPKYCTIPHRFILKRWAYHCNIQVVIFRLRFIEIG